MKLHLCRNSHKTSTELRTSIPGKNIAVRDRDAFVAYRTPYWVFECSDDGLIRELKVIPVTASSISDFRLTELHGFGNPIARCFMARGSARGLGQQSDQRLRRVSVGLQYSVY
jgi:hypothetical protein